MKCTYAVRVECFPNIVIVFPKFRGGSILPGSALTVTYVTVIHYGFKSIILRIETPAFQHAGMPSLEPDQMVLLFQTNSKIWKICWNPRKVNTLRPMIFLRKIMRSREIVFEAIPISTSGQCVLIQYLPYLGMIDQEKYMDM